MDFKVLKVDVGDWRLGKRDVRGKMAASAQEPPPDTQVHTCKYEVAALAGGKAEISGCLKLLSLSLGPFWRLQEFSPFPPVFGSPTGGGSTLQNSS